MTTVVDDLLNPDVDQKAVALNGDAFEHLVKLADSGAVTSTAFMLERKMPWERYEALCAYMGSMNRSCSWWIGDLLLYGEMVFGERYAQAAEMTGLAPQTLMNRVYVCKAIPPERRVPGVPFSVHALVAPLSAAEQKKWLRLALKHRWTRAELTHQLRAETRESTEEPEPEPAAIPEGTADRERTVEESIEPGALLLAVKEIVKQSKPSGDGLYYLVPIELIAALDELTIGA